MKFQEPSLRAWIARQSIENPLSSQQINPTHPLPFVDQRQVGCISATLPECGNAPVVDV